MSISTKREGESLVYRRFVAPVTPSWPEPPAPGTMCEWVVPLVVRAFAQVPRHLVAEVIRGVLVTQPRPAARYARAASRLGTVLGPFDLGGAANPFDAIEFDLAAFWAR